MAALPFTVLPPHPTDPPHTTSGCTWAGGLPFGDAACLAGAGVG